MRWGFCLFPAAAAMEQGGLLVRRHVCPDSTLMVFADKFSGASDLAWNLKLAKEAGEAKVAGNVVFVGDPAGANMRVTFVGDKPLTLTPALQATGSEEYFVVITVQNGAAPAVKAEGDTVTVGGQTVRRDGHRLKMGK
jgi:hypothetical protein